MAMRVSNFELAGRLFSWNSERMRTVQVSQSAERRGEAAQVSAEMHATLAFRYI